MFPKSFPDAIKLIKEFEGYYEYAYLCPAKVATIGWGTISYSVVKRYGRKTVKLGDFITKEEAEAELNEELYDIWTRLIPHFNVAVTTSMESALLSFAYNTGIAATLDSTMFRRLNMRDYLGAQEEFDRWVKAKVNGKSVSLPGLVRRRDAEQDLFDNDGIPKNTKRSTLSIGSVGEQVEDLHKMLSKLGYIGNAAGNKFTTTTKAAVKWFQSDKKLVADGIVGPATWKALEP